MLLRRLIKAAEAALKDEERNLANAKADSCSWIVIRACRRMVAYRRAELGRLRGARS